MAAGVVAVDLDRLPAGGAEPGDLVGRVGERELAVDRDAVVVPEDDQLVQPEMAGQRDRLLADALHQAAVAGDHPGAVVDDPGPETGRQRPLGDGQADGIAEPLAERPGRGLEAGRMAALGVAGGARAELAEVADFLQRHVGMAGQVQHGIEQHRAVPGRQDEAVAVGPGGVARVVFQMPIEQHGGDVGHAHRHARDGPSSPPAPRPWRAGGWRWPSRSGADRPSSCARCPSLDLRHCHAARPRILPARAARPCGAAPRGSSPGGPVEGRSLGRPSVTAYRLKRPALRA